jgi:PAS domain S-box-containing protein
VSGAGDRDAEASRRTAEPEVSALEAGYLGILEAIPLTTWIFDLETLGFLAVNEAAVRHYGYDAAEFATMTLEDIRPPEDVPFLRAYLRDGGLPDATSAWRHRRKDGSIIHVELRGHDLVFGGRPARLIVVDDVTQPLRVKSAFRRTEAQLRQAQRMEAIATLAGGIAHDFNNLLQVILSYSGLLQSALPAGDGTREDVEEIQKAGERASELMRQLLAFSRQQVQELRLLDVNSVVAGLGGALRSTLGEGVHLVVRLAADLGRVRADRGQLEQIVTNLASNARDAMPNGGTLTLETATEVLDDEYARTHAGATAGAHVVLAVSDDGVGMNKATIERIFEPFFTTKALGRGTGLGLATVYGIVQQSRGSLSVQSEPGKGTTFKVYLPVGAVPGSTNSQESGAERERSSGKAGSSPSPGGATAGAETILLLEDEEPVRRVARDILERCGYHVLEAASGLEALSVCEQHKRAIHLLLTDVVLARASGSELAQQMRGLWPGMRVLLMSGYPGEAVVHRGVFGADLPFIEKPLTPESLATKVREVLGG